MEQHQEDLARNLLRSLPCRCCDGQLYHGRAGASGRAAKNSGGVLRGREKFLFFFFAADTAGWNRARFVLKKKRVNFFKCGKFFEPALLKAKT